MKEFSTNTQINGNKELKDIDMVDDKNTADDQTDGGPTVLKDIKVMDATYFHVLPFERYK